MDVTHLQHPGECGYRTNGESSSASPLERSEVDLARASATVLAPSCGYVRSSRATASAEATAMDRSRCSSVAPDGLFVHSGSLSISELLNVTDAEAVQKRLPRRQNDFGKSNIKQSLGSFLRSLER